MVEYWLDGATNQVAPVLPEVVGLIKKKLVLV